jgi:hypothetical protein
MDRLASFFIRASSPKGGLACRTDTASDGIAETYADVRAVSIVCQLAARQLCPEHLGALPLAVLGFTAFAA